jgi:hypothetical protein
LQWTVKQSCATLCTVTVWLRIESREVSFRVR